MNDKTYAKDCIRQVMSAPEMKGRKLAVHEIQAKIKEKTGCYHSENSIATRLSEMARFGEMVGSPREGTSFKEWQYLGYHTFSATPAAATRQGQDYYFFSLDNKTSPNYLSWKQAMTAAARHLNDTRKTITVFTGTPEAPRKVVTLSK